MAQIAQEAGSQDGKGQPSQQISNPARTFVKHARTQDEYLSMIELNPCAGALGAEVSGIDLCQPLHDETLAKPGGRARLAQMVEDNPPVEHPVVHTHPESGKKCPYVNSLFTVSIKGMKKKESNALLEFLFDHAVTPEYTCRFRWQPNSVAFRDNRIVQHKPVNDYWLQRRKMQRITIDDS